VLAIKSVKQNYVPTPEILQLMEDFRKMLNDCIRIGIAENVTSKKSLNKKAYHQLLRYNVPTYYRLTAISKAVGIISNYRKTLKQHPEAKKPFATKRMLTDCYGFRIIGNNLRLVGKHNKGIYIPLNKHTRTVISAYAIRSISLNTCTLSIAFSKETPNKTPITGLIGIDRNLDNVTTATLNGQAHVYDLSEVSRIKSVYRTVKSHLKRNDARIRKKIFGKYGRKQRNRVNQRLHLVTRAIVRQAVADKQGIVMEDLKGIRKLYRKGNGQGREYRSRLNSWSFYELQRQVEYKAHWEGIPVIYVKPQKTSSVCSICGSPITECAERKVYCSHCKRLMDRDENAAYNIVQRGLRFKPDGFASEAMVKERQTPNPSSRCEPVTLHDPKVNTFDKHLKMLTEPS
jgi:putative transposase